MFSLYQKCRASIYHEKVFYTRVVYWIIYKMLSDAKNCVKTTPYNSSYSIFYG